MSERQRPHFLRQVMLMAAQDRAHGATAAAELRHARRPVTGAAGALLLVHLLAGAMDLAAAERLVIAGPALGELPAHHARDQIGARLETEDRVAELERARGRPVHRRHVEFHDRHSPFGASAGSDWAPASAWTRNLPGSGASFGKGFLTASRIAIQPPA